MKKKNLHLSIAIAVGVVIIAATSYGVWKMNKDIDNSVIKIEQNAENAQNSGTSDWQTYTNSEFNISFSYPKEFGEITIQRDGTDHIAFLVLKDKTLLAIDNGTQSVARGAYWGDTAEFITDQKYITTKCDNQLNCNIITNKHNVTFAKEKATNTDYDGTTKDVLFYYFFNPNSEFRGLIMSDARLKNSNIPNLEEKMDLIANSIHFKK